MARGQRDPARERFWRDVLRRHNRSGLTARAFCAREQLAETAFYAWRRILRQRDAERRQAPAAMPGPAPDSTPDPAPSALAPAFVPVVVRQEDRDDAFATAATAADILIELRGGRVMRLAASMPVERVARLIRAIEAADPNTVAGQGAA